MSRHKPPEKVRLRPKVVRELDTFDARMRDTVTAIQTEKGRYLAGILDALGIDTKRHNYSLERDNRSIVLVKAPPKDATKVEPQKRESSNVVTLPRRQRRNNAKAARQAS